MRFIMGDMADQCDESMECAIARHEFDEMLQSYKNSREKHTQYTSHLIYQNHLMDCGLNLKMRQSIASELYHVNTAKKVKEYCTCPSCGAEFIKISYQQKFCKSKVKGKSSCKDFFHNFVNPSRMARLNWDHDMNNEDVTPLNFRNKNTSIRSMIYMISNNILRLEYFIGKDKESWDDIKKSQYIESILIRAPMMPFVLYNDMNDYCVIDGMQRLKAIMDFFDGNLKLTNLNFLHSLNGHGFGDLQRAYQRRIEETNVIMESIESIANPKMAHIVAVGYL